VNGTEDAVKGGLRSAVDTHSSNRVIASEGDLNVPNRDRKREETGGAARNEGKDVNKRTLALNEPND
jgi:hypothetical protein